ncbi:flagellar assembly protein FliH [Lentibacillus sp. Marseille-P4043]|uniref:flagellar assembly protein FliH n=1 Tax=Lentibacillus sp. Marseille-P4043 TaxID=2040293 RepID=UPI00131A6007|nr:flagellar assembly protein FliH [Lentibacillus sp. Marseille-P4043]
MSNSNSYNAVNGKEIKIKPIEQIRQTEPKQNDDNSLENEQITLQHKLNDMRAELKQLETKKVQILQEAQQTIEQDKEEWEKTKETYRKQAQEEGYNEGFATGKQESLEQYQQLLDKANQIISSATVDYHATIEQSEEIIIDLAIHTAEKIINQTLVDSPETFLSIVKAAIKEIKDQSVITVNVNPDNYEFIVQQKDELYQLLPEDTKLTVHLTEELNPDSCIIEHPFGQIDASVDTQLKQLREILHELTLENEQ